MALGHMNKDEARAVANGFLASYRAKPYPQLAALVGSTQIAEVTARSGTSYQIELEVFWDDPKSHDGVLRVRAAVDDKALRAFLPLCEDFLIKPDGTFGDENVA